MLGKVANLSDSVAKIADSFERLVALLEDVAEAIDLPVSNRAVPEVEAEGTGEP